MTSSTVEDVMGQMDEEVRETLVQKAFSTDRLFYYDKLTSDATVLRCPKCGDRMTPLLLHLESDGMQNVWWTCVRVNAKEGPTCNWPLKVPAAVFWVKRTPLDIEQGIVPRPNMRFLPTKFRHLYPSIFPGDASISAEGSQRVKSRQSAVASRSDGISVVSSHSAASSLDSNAVSLRNKRPRYATPRQEATEKAKRARKEQLAENPHGCARLAPNSIPTSATHLSIYGGSRNLNSNSTSTPPLSELGDARSPSPAAVEVDGEREGGEVERRDNEEEEVQMVGEENGIPNAYVTVDKEVVEKVCDHFKVADLTTRKDQGGPKLTETLAYSDHVDEIANKTQLSTHAIKSGVNKKWKKKADQLPSYPLPAVSFNLDDKKNVLPAKDRLMDPFEKAKLVASMTRGHLQSNSTFREPSTIKDYPIGNNSSVDVWNRQNEMVRQLDRSKGIIMGIRRRRESSLAPISSPATSASRADAVNQDVSIQVAEKAHVGKEVEAILLAKTKKYREFKKMKSRQEASFVQSPVPPSTTVYPDVPQTSSSNDQQYQQLNTMAPTYQQQQPLDYDPFTFEEYHELGPDGSAPCTPAGNNWSAAATNESAQSVRSSEDTVTAQMMGDLDNELLMMGNPFDEFFME